MNLEKTLAIGYYNVGNALLHSGRYTQAIVQYNKALQLSPKQVKAFTNLGVCYIALQDYPQAVQQLTKAVELSPDYFEAHYNLGYALRMQGNRAASDEHFAKGSDRSGPMCRSPNSQDEGSAGSKGR